MKKIFYIYFKYTLSNIVLFVSLVHLRTLNVSLCITHYTTRARFTKGVLFALLFMYLRSHPFLRKYIQMNLATGFTKIVNR